MLLEIWRSSGREWRTVWVKDLVETPNPPLNLSKDMGGIWTAFVLFVYPIFFLSPYFGVLFALKLLHRSSDPVVHYPDYPFQQSMVLILKIKKKLLEGRVVSSMEEFFLNPDYWKHFWIAGIHSHVVHPGTIGSPYTWYVRWTFLIYSIFFHNLWLFFFTKVLLNH